MPLRSRIRKIAFGLKRALLLLPLLASCGSSPSVDSSFSPSEDPFSSSHEDSSASFPRDEEGFKVFDSKDLLERETSGEKGKIEYGDPVDGMERYPTLRLFASGLEIPLYSVFTNPNRVWNAEAPNRQKDAVGSFSFEGKVNLKLQCAFNPKDDVTIRPLGRSIPYSVDSSRWVISFTISTPGTYVIETRYRTLHLFANPLTTAPKGAIVFGPGLHNKSNDSRINSNSEIIVGSNQHLYFAEGAILEAKLKAYDAQNASVTGPGFLLGANLERNVSKGIANVPVDFSFCKNITLSDFACIDPAGWALNLYFSEEMNLQNLKVISSRSNGDGISVQSCKNVEVEDCFVRSWDDSLVVKNYVNWRNGQEGATASIHFSNCLLITDLAQSMEIGYETIGEKMEDISFSNITILHAYHKPVFSIHNANNANIKNVRYENITVEDASMGNGDGDNVLFDFQTAHSPIWSDSHKITPLGSVNGVSCSNIRVLSGKENPKILVHGSLETRSGFAQEEHRVENVTFQDVEIYGQRLDSSYSGLTVVHADYPRFSSTLSSVKGASYSGNDASNYSGLVARI